MVVTLMKIDGVKPRVTEAVPSSFELMSKPVLGSVFSMGSWLRRQGVGAMLRLIVMSTQDGSW